MMVAQAAFFKKDVSSGAKRCRFCIAAVRKVRVCNSLRLAARSSIFWLPGEAWPEDCHGTFLPAFCIGLDIVPLLDVYNGSSSCSCEPVYPRKHSACSDSYGRRHSLTWSLTEKVVCCFPKHIQKS